MALAGRLAIIAGGLGGIGSATGRLLRSRGAQIACLYAPFEASRAQSLLQKGYGEDARDVKVYECDITSTDSVQAAFATLEKERSSAFPSILANCAGYVSLQSLDEVTAEETIKTLNSNVLGPLLVSQAFAKLYFRAAAASSFADKTPPGRIVSIASQAAHVALDKHAAYCASKAGLVGLTKCMASEWGARGITSNTISPGVVWTELGRKAWPEEEVVRRYQATIPTGRFAEPDEVAEAVGWLCGDETGMINGADLRLDGGFTIR